MQFTIQHVILPFSPKDGMIVLASWNYFSRRGSWGWIPNVPKTYPAEEHSMDARKALMAIGKSSKTWELLASHGRDFAKTQSPLLSLPNLMLGVSTCTKASCWLLFATYPKRGTQYLGCAKNRQKGVCFESLLGRRPSFPGEGGGGFGYMLWF